MKIISWNVNGLRAIVQKNFLAFLQTESPDILCLQEVKMGIAAIEKEKMEFPGYQIIWNPAERPGYSGTALLIKNGVAFNSPLGRGVGAGELIDDPEGRIQHVELEKFHLINTYFPNANHELSRLFFKLDFNRKLFAALKQLEKTKPVVICGDFNVAHEAIDLARPKENVGSPGFTPEEREAMSSFLVTGFADVFREFYPEAREYTWWSYRAGARRKNIGWRIDYFCVSQDLLKKVKKIEILGNIMGSDHCPVSLELEA